MYQASFGPGKNEAEYLRVSFKSGLCLVGPYRPLAMPYRPLIHVTGYQLRPYCPLAMPYRPPIHVTGYQLKFLANCYAEFSLL
jgi:hypothetical protein